MRAFPPTPPLPGYVHPSWMAYGAGCRCEGYNGCAEWKYRNRKAYRMAGLSLIDIEEVRVHLRGLVTDGHSPTNISRAAGNVARDTVRKIIDGEIRRSRQTTVSRLLSVTHRSICVNAVGKTNLPSIGTVRRLDALRLSGWTLAFIANGDVQVRRRLTGYVGHPELQVTGRYWHFVENRYQRLSLTAGPSTRLHVLLSRKGAALPFAWDDETIDDPAARPDLGARPDRGAWLEDVQELREQHLGPRTIASRLRATPAALEIRARRIGNLELAAFFERERRLA